MTTLAEAPLPTDRRVCVWFGTHKIVEHVSEPGYAEQFEIAMRCRFKSLRVTNEPVVPDVDLS
jgi:hypothetical protein